MNCLTRIAQFAQLCTFPAPDYELPNPLALSAPGGPCLFACLIKSAPCIGGLQLVPCPAYVTKYPIPLKKPKVRADINVGVEQERGAWFMTLARHLCTPLSLPVPPSLSLSPHRSPLRVASKRTLPRPWTLSLLLLSL